MGSVWHAEHIDLGTPAAVKLIDETFAQSPEALTRFRREAQAAASLRSGNVVQILDYGVDGETPFIAMELLEGESLADRLERLGRLDPASCTGILQQVSKALARAHDSGIVHRDLKPDNIFLVRDGDDEVAKVLDFGIAKRTGALQTSSDMATRTGSLMGTPYYMSPEQASGRRQVDHRTDIWAFAVIAYECVTGRRPFDDSNLGGLLLSICTELPVPASQIVPVPPAFDAWFARCTAKDPTGRYESIRETSLELCRAIGVAMPASRLFSSSQPDGAIAQQLAVQSVTSPWGKSRGTPSAVTPGAVIMTANGTNIATVSAGSRRPPLWLIATGLLALLGIVSAVTALVWRSTIATPVIASVPVPVTAAVAQAPAAQVPTAQPTTQAATAAPAVSLVVPVQKEGKPEGELPQNGGTKDSAGKATKGRATTTAPRQTSRQTSSRTNDPAPTPRLRPQDRLERDLGF